MSTIAATFDPYRTNIGLSPTLQRPTLVLNRNWQPINVATVARALIIDRMNRVKSWSKFISEAYWIVELED